ncbi:MAG: methyltransferase domain-containing protein [Pseudomonadota bacterium]
MAHDICPWWLGYLLASPLRRLIENPESLLGPFVKPGMTVVDYGCGMGFFTLPMARMVGPAGKVKAVDVQEKMLAGMERRARKHGLADRITAVRADVHGALTGIEVDFVAALHVVHELKDREAFFGQMLAIMKPGAKMLVVEPRHHVKDAEFRESVDLALSNGFVGTDEIVSGRDCAAVLMAPVHGNLH